MRKLIILLFLILIIVTGCSNSLNYSITYLDEKSVDGYIQKWIEKNRKMNGIYLGKNEDENYYLYINYSNPVSNQYSSINAVSINSNSSSSININIKPRPSDQKSEKVFYIEVKESPLNTIILNGEEIKTSSIPSIQ